MKLEQQVVSLQLAKKLKKLGVKQESLIHWQLFHGYGDAADKWELRHFSDFRQSSADPEYETSAFTVAELGEFLPLMVHKDGKEYRRTFRSNRGNHSVEYWFPYEGKHDYRLDPGNLKAETEADARAKMLIYLLENKLLTLK
jgi:hypothetical protein